LAASQRWTSLERWMTTLSQNNLLLWVRASWIQRCNVVTSRPSSSAIAIAASVGATAGS
jgi:hypothetical protein